MKREKLSVEKRSITGKKVRKLRREGLLPANIYGRDFKSAEVQMPTKDFIHVYKIVKETGLVDIEYDGKVIPVLIKNVQINPQSQDVLHADFHKVNLKEKITAKIPVVSKGEAMAVLEKKGDIIQPLTELEVEALPTDLPEKIEIAIDGLAEVNDQITVEQITAPSNTTILTDPSQILFKIVEFAKEEVVEAPAVEEGAEGEAVLSEEKDKEESSEAEKDETKEAKKEEQHKEENK